MHSAPGTTPFGSGIPGQGGSSCCRDIRAGAPHDVGGGAFQNPWDRTGQDKTFEFPDKGLRATITGSQAWMYLHLLHLFQSPRGKIQNPQLPNTGGGQGNTHPALALQAPCRQGNCKEPWWEAHC